VDVVLAKFFGALTFFWFSGAGGAGPDALQLFSSPPRRLLEPDLLTAMTITLVGGFYVSWACSLGADENQIIAAV